MTHDATRRQIAAADPARSTWLTANAGSGKTRVLTDRVARLLLEGTPPERILCLTYTKAAAGEMQNRLLGRLGGWAMMPDAALSDGLAEMGTSATDLPAARRLFARAIEAPGGLKVQTIHAFCAAILRRFPLEAGVAPGFAELDERSATQLRAEIVEEMAAEGVPEIDDLVSLHGGHEVDRLLSAITGAQARFDTPPDPTALWDYAGLPQDYDTAALVAEALTPGDTAMLVELMPLLRQGLKTDSKLADSLAEGDWDNPGLAEIALLEGCLLYGDNTASPFGAKLGKIPTKALRGGICAHLADDLDAFMSRIEDTRPRRLALRFCERSAALHRFANVFGARFAAEKRAHGWLDFDDLIARTARLLSRSSMAQWVLFRLDGGIDHILVDEAQDTSPPQWQVIERLVAEFTAGAGARDATRTLFVVGDPKQSIYSFQGADAAVFAERRTRFAADFAAAGAAMQGETLTHSFRSSPAILTLVDQVFQGEAAQGIGDPPRHLAFRPDQPGRVDLWPPVPAPDKADDPPWWQPASGHRPPSAEQTLARQIAAQIADMLGTPFHDIRGGKVRALEAGDVLILVQRRKDLFQALIPALKAAGLPVAGADRMKLSAELAVRDITALLTVLATPEDDLSLAATLRSPLFGLSEDDLYRLAAGRDDTLWAALRGSGFEAAKALLSDMISVSRSLRPFELISRLLIRNDGRARLVARLGPEAEDGIAELLSQALAYEAMATPSLTGFLVWLGGGDVEVKRGPGGGGMVRVMTVHGAKGLESPVVILPDTAKRKPPNGGQHLPLPDRPAVWRGTKAERPGIVAQAVADETRRAEEERRRLLYVALTRAESWLIVAAAGDTGDGTDSWHAMVTQGFDRASARALGLCEDALPLPDGGAARRLSWGDWPETTAIDKTPPHPPDPEEAALRAALAARPGPVARPPQPRAATALGGAKVVAGFAPDAAEAEDAMLSGTRLHLLLEHLPDLAPDDRPAAAADLLAASDAGLPEPPELARLLAEAEAVLTAPELAEIYAVPAGATVLREVELAADLSGLGTITGTVDRLIVEAERVLAIDYKTNALVPATPEATPEGILRQMAAYRAALALIYPGRAVDVAILWTRTRSLMPLPAAILHRSLVGLTRGEGMPSSGA